MKKKSANAHGIMPLMERINITRISILFFILSSGMSVIAQDKDVVFFKEIAVKPLAK